MAGWTKLQVVTLLFCFVLSMFDGADVLVVSFVAPLLTAEWQVSEAIFSLAFSSGLAGMMLGALGIAPFADVWGRKILLLLGTLTITSGMLGSAFVESLQQLVVLRFWTGLGIGAMLASLSALASEYAPARYRAFAVTFAVAGYPAGATVAGLAAGIVLPEYGWRGMFLLVGLASLILLPFVWLLLPESVQFLLARQPKNALERANRYLMAQGLPPLDHLPARGEAATGSPVRRLFAHDLRFGTLLIWGAFFFSFFTLYFLTSWIPRIGVGAGYPLSTAINGSLLFNVGAFFGLITLGWFAARVELAKLIGIFFLLSAACMVIFGALHTPVLVFYAGMILIGFLVQGGFGGLYAVATRFYPTEAKTTGVGWAIGIGRFGAIAGPAVGGIMISAGLSVFASFAVFAIPMLLAAAMTWLVAILCFRPARA